MSQIDEEITAGQEIEFREGRVAEQIVFGKHHEITNLFLHAITAVLLGKKPLQPRRRQISGNSDRIEAGPRRLNGPLVQVGGKNM